ncbi:MAG: hypothetical protein ACYC5N_02665, partial [Endomicrobiales bacterium]
FRGRNEEKVAEAAQKTGAALLRFKAEDRAAFDILGPSPAARLKLHNLFRWQILLKGEYETLHAVVRRLKEIPMPSGVMLSIDVDPQDTL